MAILNFALSVPDDQVPRILAAMRYAYRNPTMTTAEIVEALRQNVRETVKGVVVNYERLEREKTLATPVAPPDVT